MAGCCSEQVKFKLVGWERRQLLTVNDSSFSRFIELELLLRTKETQFLQVQLPSGMGQSSFSLKKSNNAVGSYQYCEYRQALSRDI